MNDNISDKDKKDWQNFISSKEKILDKDFNPKIKNNLKVRSIDLHGYTLEQANNAIEKFILKAFEEEVSKLIVVTGKGIHSDVEKDPYVSKDLSILKYSVKILGSCCPSVIWIASWCVYIYICISKVTVRIP